jgi:hypothetical protein
MHDPEEIGLLAFIVGVEKHRVLHDVGVDVALEHGVVGFQSGRELEVADSIAFLLELRFDAGLELVDIGARNEADLELGLGRPPGQGFADNQDGNNQKAGR